MDNFNQKMAPLPELSLYMVTSIPRSLYFLWTSKMLLSMTHLTFFFCPSSVDGSTASFSSVNTTTPAGQFSLPLMLLKVIRAFST